VENVSIQFVGGIRGGVIGVFGSQTVLVYRHMAIEQGGERELIGTACLDEFEQRRKCASAASIWSLSTP